MIILKLLLEIGLENMCRPILLTIDPVVAFVNMVMKFNVAGMEWNFMSK